MDRSEKNDVFVGNLTFDTTEEQLRRTFGYMGPVKNVRILLEKDTGKPRGFAFVEFYEASSALNAIRQLDGAELNNRKIRVSFSNQGSSLKDVAKQTGQFDNLATSMPIALDDLENRQQKLKQVVGDLKLHEAWDLLAAMKKLITEDKRGVKMRDILSAHPQLIGAMYEIQKRLGIVLPAHVQQQQQLLMQDFSTSRHSNSSQAAAVGKISATGSASAARSYHNHPYNVSSRDHAPLEEQSQYRFEDTHIAATGHYADGDSHGRNEERRSRFH